MSSLSWLLAASLAAAIAAWAYAEREERVPGRAGPAILRGIALFLVLAGLGLPALRGRIDGAPARVALLDVSASMSLPVRPADEGAPSRLDSARAELAALGADRVYAFGAEARGLEAEEIGEVTARAPRTRLAPALEAARLGGADSVWVLTDGGWEDRDVALETARRLGLGLREIRVAGDEARAGLAHVDLPARARAGDTVRAGVEVRATGPGPDSISVSLVHEDRTLAAARIARPDPGRSSSVELAFIPNDPGAESEWRRYEVRLEAGADPFAAAGTAFAWMEVSRSATGAVLVSTVADWEARFLVPTLDRLVLGGAAGFLRLGEGRWLELAPRPRVTTEERVRAALRGARLLVVHAAPADIPDWLARALDLHPRTLALPAGSGRLPGPGLTVSGPLPGEWYAMPPIPSSPAAPFLSDIELDALPPARELYALQPAGRWTVLSGSRDRRGESRPLMVADERGETRWAVAPASEWWRWALRGNEGRRAYDAVFAGVVGWLVEDAAVEVVALADRPAAGRPLAWRVRPDARGVSIRVADAAGEVVWSGEWLEPPARIVGPALSPGRYEATVTAEGPGGRFEATRPLEPAPDARELLPVAAGPVVRLEAAARARDPVEARAPRPVWPFAVAVALLCLEWIWRHRIGLR